MLRFSKEGVAKMDLKNHVLTTTKSLYLILHLNLKSLDFAYLR